MDSPLPISNNNVYMIDGEVKFTTNECQYMPSDKKMRHKGVSLAKQVPMWHEVFVLYYDK